MIFIKEHIHNYRKLLENDILKLILDDPLLNIVGEESINFALKNKFIEKKGIILIKNIPHALLL